MLWGWACSSTGPLVPASVVIMPDPLQLKQGNSAGVTAIVVDAEGAEIADLVVTLTIGDPDIAQLSGGQVTGVAPGATTITGTYADLSGSADVEVYGHPARATLTPVTMSGGPFGTAISRGGRMFVARHFADTVSSAVLPGTAFGTHLLVGDDPTSLAVDSAGERLYITKQFSQNVGVADVAAATSLVDSFPVTGDPFIVVVSPDQSSLFVTTNANNVQKIVLSSRQVSEFDSYATVSNGIAFHPSDTLMYVATVNGNVYEYNLRTGGDLRTFTAAGQFQGLGVSDDGAELYVADETGGLRTWNLATGAALPPLMLAGGPFDLKVTPDGAEIWVSLSSGGEVVVIDRASRTIIDTIPTGGTPRRIAFDRFGAVGVIGNEAGWADIVR
jgi:YVTN family beta-propeller protein